MSKGGMLFPMEPGLIFIPWGVPQLIPYSQKKENGVGQRVQADYKASRTIHSILAHQCHSMLRKEPLWGS